MPTGSGTEIHYSFFTLYGLPRIQLLFVQGSDTGHAHVWALCIAVVARVFRPLAISDTALNAMSPIVSAICGYPHHRLSGEPAFVSRSQNLAFERGRFHLTAQSIPGTITSARQAESPVIVVSLHRPRRHRSDYRQAYYRYRRGISFQLSQQGFQ